MFVKELLACVVDHGDPVQIVSNASTRYGLELRRFSARKGCFMLNLVSAVLAHHFNRAVRSCGR